MQNFFIHLTVNQIRQTKKEEENYFLHLKLFISIFPQNDEVTQLQTATEHCQLSNALPTNFPQHQFQHLMGHPF